VRPVGLTGNATGPGRPASGGPSSMPTPRTSEIGVKMGKPHVRVQIGPCVLHLGDCREGIGRLESVPDVTIADPPYGDTSLDWDVLSHGWQGLVPGNSLWCFGSMRYFLRAAECGAFSGWGLAQDVVWEKQNGSSFHSDRFKRVHELVVHWYRGEWRSVYHEPQFTNDATKRTVRRKKRPPHTGHIEEGHYVSEDGGPRMMRSVIYQRNCHGYAIHPTEKPVGLLEPLICYSCPPGGLVVDPFFGSGAVAEACILTGRRFVGWEIDTERFEDGCRRVERAWSDLMSRLPLAVSQ
jgi:site-specific DNA-methyltransferase (adenine-specific)